MFFCHLAPKSSVICKEFAVYGGGKCKVCAWNPKNVELREKRLERAIEKARKTKKTL